MKMNVSTSDQAEAIAAYRQTVKLYDVFTFFNELELLEIRLHILDPYVDYFVIVECTETFSGRPKKLWYEENQQLYQKFAHKIIHYVTRDVPASEEDFRRRLLDKNISTLDREIISMALVSDNVPKGQLHWLKEFYQKESIKKALLGLAENDVCYVSDVDEIWNPAALVDFRQDDVFKLRQKVYAYYLNNRSSEPWAGTLVTKYKNISDGCLNHLRTVAKTKYTYIDNGGWHFTNQGGADRVRLKLESYGHQEFNTPKIKAQIEKKMHKNRDFIGRKFDFWLDENDLPLYILENQAKYQHLFTSPPAKNVSAGEEIVIKLQGGLGNQLFQYAVGRSLALRGGRQVSFDLSWFATQKKRQYELGNLRVEAPVAKPETVRLLQKYKGKSGRWAMFNFIFRADDNIYIREKGFAFDSRVLAVAPPAYLDGFWQSEKYFVRVRAELLKELLPRHISSASAALRQDISQSNAVSLHIRRSDYLTEANGFYHVCALEYYTQGIARIAEEYPDMKIFVFSDDLAWARANLRTTHPVVFVEGLTSWEDMSLMSMCRHNIICNSTFSWWGAWLNSNPDKMVIAPRKWFTDPEIDISDLIPDSWQKI